MMKQLAHEPGCRRALGQADIVGELTSMAMTSGSSLQQNPGDRDAIVRERERSVQSVALFFTFRRLWTQFSTYLSG